DSVTITNLPENTTYKVNETNPGEGYAAVAEQSGTIVADQTAEVTVANKYTKGQPVIKVGSLSVMKVKAENSDDFDPTMKFEISIKLNVPNANMLDDIAVENGSLDGDTVYAELATGDIVLISNLPMGTTYVVSETQADGFVKVDDQSGEITSDTPVQVTVANRYLKPAEPVGSLKVVKVQADGSDEIDASMKFDITIDLTAPAGKDLSKVTVINGTLNGTTVTAKLGKDESVTIQNLPKGTVFKVNEAAVEDFDNVAEQSGTVAANVQTVVTLNNKYTNPNPSPTPVISGSPIPTDTPTPIPTDTPTPIPTDTPTPVPTDTPTPKPTPTNTPTPVPTPTNTPKPKPTPTNTPVPTDTPTPVPTDTPTPVPTDTPTPIPTDTPTPAPTNTPTPPSDGDVSGGNRRPTETPTPTTDDGTAGRSRRVKTGDAPIYGRVGFAAFLIVAGLAIVLFRKRILGEVKEDK
ncbi:MAG: hypothetical protein J5752_11200, partial [Clostridiales bacterium]|nr:hypothetical protein [Clostridiales bacterium]